MLTCTILSVDQNVKKFDEHNEKDRMLPTVAHARGESLDYSAQHMRPIHGLS